MIAENILCFSALILPSFITAITQEEIIQGTVLNQGDILFDKFPTYRNVLDLSERQHIRFSLKASRDVCILFSERHANTITYPGPDLDYVEVSIGGLGNAICLIRVGTMHGTAGQQPCSGILNNAEFRHFWISWGDGYIKVGSGFEIGQSILVEDSYPATTEVKFLAIWNGWGSNVDYQIYAGVYILSHASRVGVPVSSPWGMEFWGPPFNP